MPHLIAAVACVRLHLRPLPSLSVLVMPDSTNRACRMMLLAPARAQQLLSLPLPVPCLCRSAKYGSAYESARFSHNTADGITMVGVGCIAALVRRQGLGRCCCWAAVLLPQMGCR